MDSTEFERLLTLRHGSVELVAEIDNKTVERPR